MASDIVDVHVRLPRALHRRLHKDAAKSGNSLNNEIVAQLETLAEDYDRLLADYKQLRADHDRLFKTFENFRGDFYDTVVALAMKAADQGQDVPRESAPAYGDAPRSETTKAPA